MTLPAPQANDPISADMISAENTAARQTVSFDNPNPDYGNPQSVPDAPSGETVNQDQPSQLSKREQIAQNARAARQAADAELGEPVQNEMGEYIPPFIAKQEDDAEAERLAAEEEAKAKTQADAEPKPYTLKVRGNDVPVKDRAELVKLAEVEDDEAGDFTDAQLIKLAQKQLAANAILDEAKAAKKSARTTAREADDTLSDPDPVETGDPDPSDDDDDDQAPHQSRADKHRQLIEKIQFGEAEEAAAAFAEAVSEGVKEVVAEEKYGTRLTNVTNIIKQATTEFEKAHADLVSDHDYADLVYNKAFVSELKKDLISQGLKPENVERVVGNDVRTAMNAYVTIAADGRVKVRPPNQMFDAAAQNVRTKFNRPAPSRQPGTQPVRTAPRVISTDRRLDAKRALPQQPNRASVPRTTPAPARGQTPAARSNVVAEMRKARGQG